MRKVNISVYGVRVAAFKIDSIMTAIVKRTKAGHFFLNIYVSGRKCSAKYFRISGLKLSKFLGVAYSQINKKLFDSTLKIELKKRSRMFGVAA